jgi:hypothetical protein
MDRFKRPALLCFAVFAALSLGACAWLDSKQKDWIFAVSDRAWGGYVSGTTGYEDVFIPVGNERIHAWWAKAPGTASNAPTVLYLHGSRWNLSGSVHRIARWQARGFNVLAIDYRGFGRSSPGQPSEAKCYEDARAALAWLRAERPGAGGLYLVGHSLGGAVAIELAIGDAGVAGIVVESTFTSMYDMASRTAARFLPLDTLLTQRFDSIAKVGRLNVPILIVHGTQDSLVPVEMAHALYAKARDPKQLLIIEGASHHNVGPAGGAEYDAAIRRWLAASRRPALALNDSDQR